MIFFILSRMLDVATTLLEINKWGYGIEGNPWVRVVMEKGLFIPYQILMTCVVILVAENLPKCRKVIYGGLTVLGLFVTVTNLGCYLFIK